jgi:hypothetical protein
MQVRTNARIHLQSFNTDSATQIELADGTRITIDETGITFEHVRGTMLTYGVPINEIGDMCMAWFHVQRERAAVQNDG